MAFAAFMASEAFMPVLAAGVGVTAAAAFIATGGGGPEPFVVEKDEDEADGEGKEEPSASSSSGPRAAAKDDADGDASTEVKDAAATGELAKADAGGGGGETQAEEELLQQLGAGGKTSRLTAEQEAKLRKSLQKLKPEAKKALEDWVNMKEESIWPLLAMNVLVICLFLGIFICFSGYLIVAHEINIYNRQTWRNGLKLAEDLLRQYRILSPRSASSGGYFSLPDTSDMFSGSAAGLGAGGGGGGHELEL